MSEEWFGYRRAEDGSPSEPNVKQALAHASPAYELLYGGAAGGGKTEWAVVEAGTVCLTHPGAEAAIFRRTYKELEQSVLGRIHSLLGRRFGSYHASQRCYQFVNGSRLWLHYCAREQDVYSYQSAQWQLLLLDEASHFTDYQRSYLKSRVRSPFPSLRPRVRYGSNPGGVGHQWLKRSFIAPPPEETGGRIIRPYDVWRPEATRPGQVRHTRQFIPARLHDNERLMEADPDYLYTLMDLPDEERRMLLEGDWDAFKGQVFGEFSQWHVVTSADDELMTRWGLLPGQRIPWHVLPVSDYLPPRSAVVWGSVDYGYAAPWSFHLHAGLPDGQHVVTFYEAYRAGLRDLEQCQWIRRVLEAADDAYRRGVGGWPRPTYIVCDPSMWNSREEMGLTKSIAEVYIEAMQPLGIQVLKGASSPGSRINGVQRLKQALAPAEDGYPVWQMTLDCPVLIEQIPSLPRDPDQPEDVDTDAEDHAYDDVRYFWMSRPALPRVPRQWQHLSRGEREDLEWLRKRMSPGRGMVAGARSRR